MQPFRHVLLGVDFVPGTSDLTRGSLCAVEQAAWVAGECGARLDVVHSTATDGYVEAPEGGYVLVHEGMPRGGEAALEALVASLGERGIRSGLRVRSERPWIAITTEAVEHRADLIVVGKHNDADGGLRLGSVAARLIRKCPVPVWSVHPRARSRPGKILAATDLSDSGAVAVEHAARLARLAGAPLHVVHAYQIPFGEGYAHPSDREAHMAALHEAAEAGVRAQLHAAESDEAHVHVGCTTPVRAILRGVEELDPDLLVLGSVSRTGIPGFLIGSTAEKVLEKADRSLLTVKPAGFVSPIVPPA